MSLEETVAPYPVCAASTSNQQLSEAPLPKLKWKDLTFWASGECQVVDERLKDLDKARKVWCPGRKNLYKAMDLTPFEDVKVVLCGQDPYPNPRFATGLAFSIPSNELTYPPTLASILGEAQRDLEGYTFVNGDLTPWALQGVFLWNVHPSCVAGKSNSHHWPEYEVLTAEIFRKLSPRGVVFAFLGSAALHYAKYVDDLQSKVVWTSHPSPLGKIHGKKPFEGSRIFTTINAKLCELKKTPIDWRL